MGPFDWLKRGRQAADPATWVISRAAGRLIVSDGKHEQDIDLAHARWVRLVPGGSAAGHGAPASMGGWQVAIAGPLGDAPVGWPIAAPEAAFKHAERVCAVAELPMEETSRKLFGTQGDPGAGLDAQ